MTSEDFTLEPPVHPGTVPQRVLDELRVARRQAKDFGQAFTDACRAQAEKFGVSPSALRRFVCALEGDTLADLSKEAEDIERLVSQED